MNEEQIKALWLRVTGFDADGDAADIIGFARALLADGGKGEAVGWAIKEKGFDHLVFDHETGEKPSALDMEWAMERGHQYIPLYTDRPADSGKGEAVAYTTPEAISALSRKSAGMFTVYSFPHKLASVPLYTAPQAECAPRKYVETQPGSPNFDGAEAYEAHLNAECAPRMWIETGPFGSDEPPRVVVDGSGMIDAMEDFAPVPAPREAQPVDQWLRDLRRAHEYLDKGEPFFTGKDCAELADLIESLAAPTPERADAGKDAALRRAVIEEVKKVIKDEITWRNGNGEYESEKGLWAAVDEIDAILAANKEPK